MTGSIAEPLAALAVGAFLIAIVCADFRDGRLAYGKDRWLERSEYPVVFHSVLIVCGTCGIGSLIMGSYMLIRVVL